MFYEISLCTLLEYYSIMMHSKFQKHIMTVARVTYATDVVFECKNRSDKLCRGLQIPCKFTKKEHINYMGIFEIVNTKINVYVCVQDQS